MIEDFPTLFRRGWPARDLDRAIASISIPELCKEYAGLKMRAPRRPSVGKKFFVGHTGVTSSQAASNRLEEHTAVALCNLNRYWPRANGGWFKLLDYQVPLKARQADAGIGKIDLLGVTNCRRFLVVELKTITERGSRGDSPLGALLEGLRYAAVLEANIEEICAEARSQLHADVGIDAPVVKLLAPNAWWQNWQGLSAAGSWGPALLDLCAGIAAQTGITFEFGALEDIRPIYGLDGRAPRFERVPMVSSVQLSSTSGTLEGPLAVTESVQHAGSYLRHVHHTLWSWADRHHVDELDGPKSATRPPVFRAEFADRNVLTPPGRHDDVLATVAPKKRHRHFGSFRSSQALTQSVFGSLQAMDRLDALSGIAAECGRSAFFADHDGWSLELEHEVRSLGEPRPTSIDVLFKSPGSIVAVECKFTEHEFGACSRPNLSPDDPSYASQYCDGTYRPQAGRSARCPLTSIGVRYWSYLPRLFAWPEDQDHSPCPLRSTYQLARNALAATVGDGSVSRASGHVLVVYDARNPDFWPGGRATVQLEAASAASLVPGLLRRLSWQRLLQALGQHAELRELTEALQDKYGFNGNNDGPQRN